MGELRIAGAGATDPHAFQAGGSRRGDLCVKIASHQGKKIHQEKGSKTLQTRAHLGTGHEVNLLFPKSDDSEEGKKRKTESNTRRGPFGGDLQLGDRGSMEHAGKGSWQRLGAKLLLL